MTVSLPSLATDAQASVGRGDLIGYSESQITVLPVQTDDNTTPCAPVYDIYMKDLLVRDLKGNLITETTVGSQVAIEATVVNDCANQDKHTLLVLFEVRDRRDFTIYLTWYNSTINSNQVVEVGASWVVPDVPGEYAVRGFYVSCLNCPMILSNVHEYKLIVLPAN